MAKIPYLLDNGTFLRNGTKYVMRNLLDKTTVVLFLEETKESLKQYCSKDDGVVEVIYGIDEILGKTEYCVTDWTRLSNLYLQAACVLEQSLPFLENGVFHKTKGRAESLHTAHIAAKPHVLAHLQSKGDKQKLSDLGF